MAQTTAVFFPLSCTMVYLALSSCWVVAMSSCGSEQIARVDDSKILFVSVDECKNTE